MHGREGISIKIFRDSWNGDFFMSDSPASSVKSTEFIVNHCVYCCMLFALQVISVPHLMYWRTIGTFTTGRCGCGVFVILLPDTKLQTYLHCIMRSFIYWLNCTCNVDSFIVFCWCLDDSLHHRWHCVYNASSFQWKIVHFDPLQTWNSEQIAKNIGHGWLCGGEWYHLLWFFNTDAAYGCVDMFR